MTPMQEDSAVWSNDDGASHKFLIHNGSLNNNGVNLKKYGVFGNPDIKYATYVMTSGSDIMTFPRSNKQETVFLYLDRQILQDRRSLFIDPETIGCKGKSWFNNDKEGASFFVVGGIPKEAIVSYYFPSTGERAVLQPKKLL